MPTLKQLVDGLTWSDLLDTLTVRSRGPRCYLFFENILKQLRYLEPVPSHMRILALYTPEEDEDYIHTCCLTGEIDPDTGKEQHWNISFTKWEEWLGMEIEPESLLAFSPAEIVAACLHDMSWDGRSQTAIRESGRKISRSPGVFISHASESFLQRLLKLYVGAVGSLWQSVARIVLSAESKSQESECWKSLARDALRQHPPSPEHELPRHNIIKLWLGEGGTHPVNRNGSPRRYTKKELHRRC